MPFPAARPRGARAQSAPGLLRRLGRRVYEYAALSFGLGLLGVISLTLSLLSMPLYYVLPRRWGGPLGRWAIMLGCRLYLAMLGLVGAYRFDIRALDALRGQSPLVIAPNHPSLLDALVIASRLPDVVCIMKAEIVDNIFLGASARLAGYLRNDAPLSMIKQAVVELKSGSHLLLFPEATRTTRWPLNPCTPAVALIAGRARVPVQTLIIETDSAYLSKGWPLWRRPSLPITYRIRLGRRFAPPARANDLTAELEPYFIDELGDSSLLARAGRYSQAVAAESGSR